MNQYNNTYEVCFPSGNNPNESSYPLPEDFIVKPNNKEKIFGNIIKNVINCSRGLKEKFKDKEFVLNIVLSDKNGQEFMKTEITHLLSI